MLCERYKKALIGAAAGAELPSAVRDHVYACADCRAALVAEQTLFAVIDRSLNRKMNEELPPAFASRVMARVADEAMPQPPWSLGLAAVAASAVLSLAIGLAWNFRHNAAIRDSNRTVVANRSLPSPEQPKSPVSTLGSAVLPMHAGRSARPRSRHVAYEIEPQVLVSADAQTATEQLIERIQRGDIDGKALVSEMREKLEIAPIVIQPLPSLAPEPGSGELPDMSALPVNTEASEDTNRRTK